MWQYDGPSHRFQHGPYRCWFFIEAQNRDEDVRSVFRDLFRYLGTVDPAWSPERAGLNIPLNFKDDEEMARAVKAAVERSGRRGGGFVTSAEGLEASDGRRFLCISFKRGENYEYWRNIAERYCAAGGRAYGDFENGMLTLNDGTSYSESQLKLIETNPPGQRASDRPKPTPERVLNSTRECLKQMRETEDTRSREFYAERVVASLGNAIRLGLNDPASVLADPAYDAVRSRADFQELLSKVKSLEGQRGS
jgi:hypothetical protein